MRILGLDVGTSTCSAWLLKENLKDPHRHFQTHRNDVVIVKPNKDGIQTIEALKPDLIVMEPTGIHPAKLWANMAHRIGAEIRWVGHSQLKAERKAYRLPSKNDDADALALAIYGLLHYQNPTYFIRWNPFSPSAELRELVIQLCHLARVQNPIINRLRQQLQHEWPEKAATKVERDWGNPKPPALWRFIAQDSDLTARTLKRYENQIVNTVGSGLSSFSKHHAQRLCHLHLQEFEIENQISEILALPEFAPYQQTFNKFGMGQRVRGMVLGHLWPIEQWLDIDKKPIVERVKSKAGKLNKRYRSLSSVKLQLGYGLVEDSSGKSSNWIPGGSEYCRKALWQWLFTRIEPVKTRPANEVCQRLGDYLDNAKRSGVPVKLARSRTVVRAVEYLFDELVQAIQ